MKKGGRKKQKTKREKEKSRSASLGAALLDRCMQADADFGGKLVELVALIDFDGLAHSVENNFAVAASFEVIFDLGPGLSGDGFVNHVVENRKKFGAGHLVSSVFQARPPVMLSA